MAQFGVPSPHKSGLYIGPQTFINVAYSTNFSDAEAAILEVPYDGAVHPTRIGSRTGPASIREHSQLVRPFQPPHATFNPLELLSLVDCGDADTTPSIIEDSFKARVHQVFKNLSAILDHANTNFGNVVKFTVFLTDMDNYAEVNEVFNEWLDEANAPARSLVAVRGLPAGTDVEIECIATI